jgi:O-antigen ligase
MTALARTRLNIAPTAVRSESAEALKSLGTKCLLVGLIGGIFALAIPMIVLAALGASLAVFLCLSCVRPIHRIGVLVLVNFACWVISGMVSGGLPLASWSSAEFWRGEGRCFLFYLPFLALSVMVVRKTDLRFVVKFICILTVFGAFMWVLWLLGLGDLFQAEEDAETGELRSSLYFVGLLTSHTGAGAFWATVTAFLLAYSLRTHERSVQLLAMVALLLTLGTGGRAATLGLIAVVAWLVARRDLFHGRAMKLAIPAVILAVPGAWIIGTLVPEVGERMGEMVHPNTFASLHATMREPTLHDASGYFHSGAGLEHHNLVIRLFLWKYSWHLFEQSPLVGIGFGRFNDTTLEFSGVPHVVNLAVDGEVYVGSTIRWELDQLMTSTGNAHNSYLHMLAETGIVGLGLFLYLWWMMYRVCRTEYPPYTSEATDPFAAAYCRGCQAAIICLGVASLAGHALAAPSGGVLLTTVVGAWLAHARWSLDHQAYI